MTREPRSSRACAACNSSQGQRTISNFAPRARASSIAVRASTTSLTIAFEVRNPKRSSSSRESSASGMDVPFRQSRPRRCVDDFFDHVYRPLDAAVEDASKVLAKNPKGEQLCAGKDGDH